MKRWDKIKEHAGGAAKYVLQLGLLFCLLAGAEVAQQKLFSRKPVVTGSPEEISETGAAAGVPGRSPASVGGSFRSNSALASRREAGYISPSSEFRETAPDSTNPNFTGDSGPSVVDQQELSSSGASVSYPSIPTTNGSDLDPSTNGATSTALDGGVYGGAPGLSNTSTATSTSSSRTLVWNAGNWDQATWGP